MDILTFMDSKFKISDHALNRFYERFSHIDKPIESLLKNSFCFGVQKGLEYLLLNKDYDIVFPVIYSNKKHVVKTILTLDQAKANLSLKFKITFESSQDINVFKPENNNKLKTIINNENNNELKTLANEENNNKLKTLANEYFKKYKKYPDSLRVKLIKEELKNILPVSNKQIGKFFLDEIAKIIYESKHKF